MIKNLNEIKNRKEVPIYHKYKYFNEKSNVVNNEKEKIYDYYLCDYCGEEIKILKKESEMDGGKIVFKNIITHQGNIEMVLHNKCLKPVLKLFEENKK